MRWFGLACFVVLLVLAWHRKDLRHYAIALLLGCIVGFVVDYGGIELGLWSFPRQPFLSWRYFLIVVPCWGVFGATINMLVDWYGESRWRNRLLLSLMILGIYEVPNLATSSWHYSVSALLVTFGWIPLVLLFRVSYSFAVSRLAEGRKLKVLAGDRSG